jgi:hypothetical protein
MVLYIFDPNGYEILVLLFSGVEAIITKVFVPSEVPGAAPGELTNLLPM